ncbi:MAG: aminotransferase class V-fold PLP-dependent enzyme [Gemmatimonadales bacterium]|nr:aminotransferase class V-fold PLP-dependent enzyme [Gemmatimonadales bacterium]
MIAGGSFLPGPVAVHPEVLAAMARPMISHRSPEMHHIMRRLQDRLRPLFRTTRPVLLGTCSATGYMELAARSAGAKLLAVDGGYFGWRFGAVAESCGVEVVRLMVPPGEVVTPDLLQDALDAHFPDAVSFVHSETATGALCDLGALARTVREHSDALVLVDAVTSVGGSAVETDAWGLDFVFTGSQKALGLPPGLALGVASERLVARARALPARGWYLDVVKHLEAAERHEPTQTPALPLVYALDHQLDRIARLGGVEGRWAHHRALQAVLYRWVNENPGWSFLAPSGARSMTVSALRPPRGLPTREVLRLMAARGYTLTGGLGELADAVVRVGHMGDITPVELSMMLSALAELRVVAQR